MITVGTIKNKEYDSNNIVIYTITLSIFKAAGSTTTPEFKSTCCVNPGTYEPYNIGDIVYVGFVNNSLEAPVILGKILKAIPTTSNETSSTYQYLNSLEITDKVVLPQNTKIGELSYSDISKYKKDIANINDLLDTKLNKSALSFSVNENTNVVTIIINEDL